MPMLCLPLVEGTRLRGPAGFVLDQAAAALLQADPLVRLERRTRAADFKPVAIGVAGDVQAAVPEMPPHRQAIVPDAARKTRPAPQRSPLSWAAAFLPELKVILARAAELPPREGFVAAMARAVAVLGTMAGRHSVTPFGLAAGTACCFQPLWEWPFWSSSLRQLSIRSRASASASSTQPRAFA